MGSGHSTVPGVVILIDINTGLTKAIMDAAYLTALRSHFISYHIISYHIISYHFILYHIISRTGAGSGAVARVLAKDACNVVIFGAGAQASAHARALPKTISQSMA